MGPQLRAVHWGRNQPQQYFMSHFHPPLPHRCKSGMSSGEKLWPCPTATRAAAQFCLKAFNTGIFNQSAQILKNILSISNMAKYHSPVMAPSKFLNNSCHIVRTKAFCAILNFLCCQLLYRVKWPTFLGCHSANAVVLYYGGFIRLVQDWSIAIALVPVAGGTSLPMLCQSRPLEPQSHATGELNFK